VEVLIQEWTFISIYLGLLCLQVFAFEPWTSFVNILDWCLLFCFWYKLLLIIKTEMGAS
jgi:hypothetical protein